MCDTPKDPKPDNTDVPATPQTGGGDPPPKPPK